MRYPMKNVDFTKDDARKGLRAIKRRKKPGPDKLKGELYRSMAESVLLVERLTGAYNEAIASGVVPGGGGVVDVMGCNVTEEEETCSERA